MKQLLWKINRLRSMDAAELGWRLGSAAQKLLESTGAGLAPVPPEPSAAFGRPWLDRLPVSIAPEPYLAVAGRLLDGKWNVLALREAPLGFPPAWNRHPQTNREGPKGFGKRLNYRDEAVTGGSIKIFWELNRHLELVTLAQAYHLSQDERYLRACRAFVESWIGDCPYPFGLNWSSSLEHAVRLTNWSIAWHLLGGEASPLFSGPEGAAFRRRWLSSIYQHCHFIAGFFSRHSSANNHLLGEYMGLFLGSVTWPCWPESAHWREMAKVGLEEEALKQTAPDGVNREQAVWYHHEVTDMMLLCGLHGRANDAEFSSAFWRRLESMLEFLVSVMDVSGNVPMIGDADDAVMVRFSCDPDFHVYRSLLATGAILFERADFAVKAGVCDEKTRWLLGDGAQAVFDELRAGGEGMRAIERVFPHCGYYILGGAFDTPEEVRLVADAGPLGYLSIAAHGHADALSFTLSAAGREILVDPGTYAYHANKIWRNYFRGTAAHNTVRVDGLNQSEIGGNFMWLAKAQARCTAWESTPEWDYFAGEHDGYSKLRDPLVHRREITFHKRDRKIEVVDTLECKGRHDIELFWHFAEDCRVQMEDGRLSFAKEGVTGTLLSTMPPGFSLRLFHGCETPIAGWVSRKFLVKEPSYTACWSGSIDGSSVMRTEIGLHT